MTTDAPEFAPDIPFLIDGGETGMLLRHHNWAATPIGPISDWPQTLRTAVAIVLHSPVPMVILWGQDGSMIYNDAYATVAGERHPALFGSRVLEGWSEVAEFTAHAMQVVLAGGRLAYKDQELALNRNGYPERIWMNLDYSPIPDESGKPAGVIAIVAETTERVLSKRRDAAAHERLQRMFAQAPGFMAMLRGPDHVFELVNPVYMRLIGNRPILGRPVREALPELQDQGLADLLDQAYATGEAIEGAGVKINLHRKTDSDREGRYLDFVLQPIRDNAGAVTHIFIQGSDVTERVQAEKHQRLLMHELNHRVKNTLATVSAIATRTLGEAESLEQAAQKLHARIMALSRAQDVLTSESWEGADIGAVVAAAMQPHADPRSIAIEGPVVRLSPRAALSLSMALHELATNAAKYGALSSDEGAVSINWTLGQEAANPALRLQWQETGGPPVTTPHRKGFGSRLIERGLAMELGGSARIEYPQAGVIFTLETNLAMVEEELQ